MFSAGGFMKAFGYIRVSGLTQLDGGGPERQKEAITAYALTYGIEIVRWFEEGYSGKELDRPVFRKMRSELLADGVRTVIVEKLDRLARDLMVSETFIADFRKNGITLVSTMEPDLCSSDPSRVFVRQILSAVAEYDRAMLVSRMEAGKERVRRTGKKCGGRKNYSEVPSMVALRDRIYFLRRQGYNLSRITEVLVAEGFRGMSGKPLFPAQVQRILKGN
jgi:DNA invertase Pin-like site-specific DNA recombinase